MAASLQELAEPEGTCFGCGQANAHGLRLKSYPDEDGEHVVAVMRPEEFHCGWPGLVYGGYLAMLVDCHSNWAAIHAHYKNEGREPGSLPRIHCATGQLTLRYVKPTPLGVPLTLRAHAQGKVGRATRILCDVLADGIVTVSADSLFFRVDAEKLAIQAHHVGNG